MAFIDKTLNCKDCGKDFVFSAREQEFYAEKGFEQEPGRCPECRKARKQQRGGNNRGRNGRGNNNGDRRQMFKTICSECGVETTVPFKPSGDRPVYCRDCFDAQR